MADSSKTQAETKTPQGLAHRLRLLQEDLADRPVKERREYLVEEVQRFTQNMMPAERQEFLNRLSTYFPAWNEGGGGGGGAGPSSSPAAATEPSSGPLSTAELVKQLRERAAASPQARAEVVQALAANQLSVVSIPYDVVKRLRSTIGMPESAGIDPVRLYDLLIHLVEIIIQMDEHVWKVRREITRGGPPQPENFREAAIKHLGPADAAKPQTQSGETLRLYLNGIYQRLTIIALTLRAFGQRWADRFAPAEIEAVVQGQGSSGFSLPWGNKTAAYWAKYAELCSGQERENLQAEVEKTYAEIFEDFERRGR